MILLSSFILTSLPFCKPLIKVLRSRSTPYNSLLIKWPGKRKNASDNSSVASFNRSSKLIRKSSSISISPISKSDLKISYLSSNIAYNSSIELYVDSTVSAVSLSISSSDDAVSYKSSDIEIISDNLERTRPTSVFSGGFASASFNRISKLASLFSSKITFLFSKISVSFFILFVC